jgi:hypothetical protein
MTLHVKKLRSRWGLRGSLAGLNLDTKGIFRTKYIAKKAITMLEEAYSDGKQGTEWLVKVGKNAFRLDEVDVYRKTANVNWWRSSSVYRVLPFHEGKRSWKQAAQQFRDYLEWVNQAGLSKSKRKNPNQSPKIPIMLKGSTREGKFYIFVKETEEMRDYRAKKGHKRGRFKTWKFDLPKETTYRQARTLEAKFKKRWRDQFISSPASTDATRQWYQSHRPRGYLQQYELESIKNNIDAIHRGHLNLDGSPLHTNPPKKNSQYEVIATDSLYDWLTRYGADRWDQWSPIPQRLIARMVKEGMVSDYDQQLKPKSPYFLLSLSPQEYKFLKEEYPRFWRIDHTCDGFSWREEKLKKKNPPKSKRKNTLLKLYKTGERHSNGWDIYRPIGKQRAQSQTKGVLTGKYYIGIGFYDNVYKDKEGNWRGGSGGILSGHDHYLLDRGMPIGEMYAVTAPYLEGGEPRTGRPRAGDRKRSRGQVWRDGEPEYQITHFEIVQGNPKSKRKNTMKNLKKNSAFRVFQIKEWMKVATAHANRKINVYRKKHPNEPAWVYEEQWQDYFDLEMRRLRRGGKDPVTGEINPRKRKNSPYKVIVTNNLYYLLSSRGYDGYFDHPIAKGLVSRIRKGGHPQEIVILDLSSKEYDFVKALMGERFYQIDRSPKKNNPRRRKNFEPPSSSGGGKMVFMMQTRGGKYKMTVYAMDTSKGKFSAYYEILLEERGIDDLSTIVSSREELYTVIVNFWRMGWRSGTAKYTIKTDKIGVEKMMKDRLGIDLSKWQNTKNIKRNPRKNARKRKHSKWGWKSRQQLTLPTVSVEGERGDWNIVISETKGMRRGRGRYDTPLKVWTLPDRYRTKKEAQEKARYLYDQIDMYASEYGSLPSIDALVDNLTPDASGQRKAKLNPKVSTREWEQAIDIYFLVSLSLGKPISKWSYKEDAEEDKKEWVWYGVPKSDLRIWQPSTVRRKFGSIRMATQKQIDAWLDYHNWHSTNKNPLKPTDPLLQRIALANKYIEFAIAHNIGFKSRGSTITFNKPILVEHNYYATIYWVRDNKPEKVTVPITQSYRGGKRQKSRYEKTRKREQDKAIGDVRRHLSHFISGIKRGAKKKGWTLSHTGQSFSASNKNPRYTRTGREIEGKENAVWFAPEEVNTIAFVGNRYGWSKSALDNMTIFDNGSGKIVLTEPAIYEIYEGIESDMEGGASGFPMLDYRSPQGSVIADKLLSIHQQAV